MRLVSEACFFSAAFIASYVYGESLVKRLTLTRGGARAAQLATSLVRRLRNH